MTNLPKDQLIDPPSAADSPHVSADGNKSEAIANILKGFEDFTLDLNGKIISSNLEAVNVTGYEEWEAIGSNFGMFYTQQDRDAGQPEKDLIKALKDNKVTFSDWRVKKRNVVFWAQITLSVVKDESGQVTGYKMVLRDQTHRLLSTKRVKRFRDEYLNVFNNSFIGILKFKLSDYRIALINTKGEKILGMSSEDKCFNSMFKNPEFFQDFIDRLMTDGKVSNFEFQINRQEEVWARIDCRAFTDEGFVEGIICDITESRKQVIELKRLNEELDDFIYHASHDLRSPLTSLLGLINLMEIDTDIELEDYCKMMRDRVTYLDDLLKDMTVIILNSKSDVTVELIDFDELNTLVYAQGRKNDKVQIHFSVENSVSFYSDKSRINTIFTNLVSNALKQYNPYSTTSPYLNIIIESDEDRCAIIFKDNGKGLKEDQLIQVFGMFYKTNSEIKEAGLSLYITKLVVNKLQGKIGLKSKLGIGSEFRIELPNLKKGKSF